MHERSFWLLCMFLQLLFHLYDAKPWNNALALSGEMFASHTKHPATDRVKGKILPQATFSSYFWFLLWFMISRGTITNHVIKFHCHNSVTNFTVVTVFKYVVQRAWKFETKTNKSRLSKLSLHTFNALCNLHRGSKIVRSPFSKISICSL